MPPIRKFRQQRGITSQSPAVFDTGQTPTVFDVGADFFEEKVAEERREEEQEQEELKRIQQMTVRDSALNTLDEFNARYVDKVNKGEAKIENYSQEAQKFISPLLQQIDDEVARQETQRLIENRLSKQKIDFQEFQAEKLFQRNQREITRTAEIAKDKSVPLAFQFTQRNEILSEMQGRLEEQFESLGIEQEEIEHRLNAITNDIGLEMLRVDALRDPEKAREAFEAKTKDGEKIPGGLYPIDAGDQLDTAETILRQQEKRLRVELERAESKAREDRMLFFDDRLIQGAFDGYKRTDLVKQLNREGYESDEIRRAVSLWQGWTAQANATQSKEQRIALDIARGARVTGDDANFWWNTVLQRNPDATEDPKKMQDLMRNTIQSIKSVPPDIQNRLEDLLLLPRETEDVNNTETLESDLAVFRFLNNPQNGVSQILRRDLNSTEMSKLKSLDRLVTMYGNNFAQGYDRWRKKIEPKTEAEQIQISDMQTSDQFDQAIESVVTSKGGSIEGAPTLATAAQAALREGLQIYGPDMVEAQEHAKIALQMWQPSDYSNLNEPFDKKPAELWLNLEYAPTGQETDKSKMAKEIFQKLINETLEREAFYYDTGEGKYLPIERVLRTEAVIATGRAGFGAAGLGVEPRPAIADRIRLKFDEATEQTSLEYFVRLEFGDKSFPLFFNPEETGGNPKRYKIPMYEWIYGKEFGTGEDIEGKSINEIIDKRVDDSNRKVKQEQDFLESTRFLQSKFFSLGT